MSNVLGLHHVTAIAGDPQRNIDFYAGVLGLRLVKRTVNFDDPQTYHFYFGDETGTPGTLMTFFPWPGARPGRQGAGQVAVTGLAIAPGAEPRRRTTGPCVAAHRFRTSDSEMCWLTRRCTRQGRTEESSGCAPSIR